MPAYGDATVDHVAKYGDHGQKEYRLFGRRGCHGGGGCRGGGCYGGGCYGGGCYGGGYGGCYGGGYGSCSGGGGYGGCCGGGWAYGSYGGGYGYASMPYGSNYYGASSYGAPVYYGGMAAGMAPGYEYGAPIEQGARGYDETRAAPATIVVRLPADARLMIDGNATRSTQDVRTFESPPLQPGKTYQYTLKAEVTRDGKTVERSRDVTVRAGQQSDVTFDLPSSGGSSGQ
jgi:uncharacterized protein (TIGR03000 family)